MNTVVRQSNFHRCSIRGHALARSVLALVCVALMSACNAQKPATGTTANTTDGKTYSEPALIGQIIDRETKKPIEGAIVYGHYATSSGTLAGGSKFGEHVKSFEAVTDANGNFKLDAWNTGDRKITGEPRGKFPMIAVYRPGYQLEVQNLNSINEFRSLTTIEGGGKAEIANNSLNWTKYPFELLPVKTEADRYFNLENASVPMMMVGACGWESYSRLLLALHNELKDWYKRNLPPEFLDKNGYAKDYGPLPGNVRQLSLVFKTMVDRLIEAKASANGCKKPDVIFKGRK
jgi:hypothetical protein